VTGFSIWSAKRAGSSMSKPSSGLGRGDMGEALPTGMRQRRAQTGVAIHVVMITAAEDGKRRR
jgi:hypothetical protein